MIIEGSWLMAILLGGLPAVGVIGRLFGDDESDDGDDEAVDDLLNDSFDDQVAFDSLEEDEDMFEEPDNRAVDEIENRVEDMETELGNLSSTVSTVRSENEEIAGVVENVEDDVRKLLEIYEMVTRGINPFIDEDVGFPGQDSANASVRLFEDDGEDEEMADEDADIDEELLEADAEEFFDEEAIDDEPLSTSEPADNDSMDMDTTSGGKSFDELKAEYESGDADWAGETDQPDTEPTQDEPIAAIDEPDPASPPQPEPPERQVATEAKSGGPPAPVPEDRPAEPTEPETADSPSTEVEEDQIPSEVAVEDFDEPIEPAKEDETRVSPDRGAPVAPGMEKPYLRHLPGHPVAELAVMEWLEYLVQATDADGARPAVRYYGRIGWIAPDVVEDLDAYLDGFGATESEDDATVRLGRTEHVATLQYLLAIDGASTRQFVGTTLDGLLAEGVLDDASPNRGTSTPREGKDPVSHAEFGADGSEDAAGLVERPPEVTEETTLPDGGLALPLDEQPSSGVGGDGD